MSSNALSKGSIKSLSKISFHIHFKLTWDARLQDDNRHPWKFIPSKILTLPNGDSVFHRNFRLSQFLLTTISLLPAFYKELLEFWEEISYSETDAVLCDEFSSICINKVSDLFDENG